jgi:hypothetical protein
MDDPPVNILRASKNSAALLELVKADCAFLIHRSSSLGPRAGATFNLMRCPKRCFPGVSQSVTLDKIMGKVLRTDGNMASLLALRDAGCRFGIGVP